MTRFVISITTLPHRLPHIGPVIESILKHNDVDKLYICLPYGDVNPKHIPQDTDVLKVIRCKDWGPITKIVGVLEEERDPDTLILTLDDDVIVTRNIVKLFKKKSKEYPNAALSLSGWSYGSFPFYFQVMMKNKKDNYADWLQGVHGILYKRKFINKKELLKFEKDDPLLFKNDDHRISAYLEYRGVDKIVIGKNPNNYFMNYGKVSGINPISGLTFNESMKFWKGVSQICEKFKKKGYYYHDSYKSGSIVLMIFIIAVLVLAFLLLLFLAGYYYLDWPIILFILLVGVLIIYYCISKYKNTYSLSKYDD